MKSAPDALRLKLQHILTEGGKIALSHFGGVRAMVKADGTQVTVADKQVEEYLVAALQETFPEDGIVSEEGSRVPGTRGVWYVDPIDGTSAYVEGLAHWGPTVARVVDGEVDIGALWLPRLGEFWYARKGRGAWRNDQRLAAGDPGQPGRHHSLFAPSRFHLAQPLPWPGKVRALGSSAAHMALVAGGAGLLAVIPTWHRWDVAAGALMITESGRRITDLQGNPVNVANCREGLPIVAGASTALDQLVQSGWLQRSLR